MTGYPHPHAPRAGRQRRLDACIRLGRDPASLEAPFCGVVVTEHGTPVAMGRVIGDGAHFFDVQGVALHPDHQARGLGREIVRRLVAMVDAAAPAKAFIGLFAAGPSAPFYAEHGFAQHPGMTGMFRVVPSRDTAEALTVSVGANEAQIQARP